MALYINNEQSLIKADVVFSDTGKTEGISKIVVRENGTDTVVWVAYYEKTYGFTGNQSMEEFVAPVTGEYQLEVWGAKGAGDGSYNADFGGGYGGYSSGKITLTAGTKLYILVGGNDGYNGGGSSTGSDHNGGGATHIAKGGKRGTLNMYKSYQSEVLIVAGGGGGMGSYSNSAIDGGHGGGESGTDGKNEVSISCSQCDEGNKNTTAKCGTQTSGGAGASWKIPGHTDDGAWHDERHATADSGSFGKGGNADGSCGGGGGGGWYGGGGGAAEFGDKSSGAGGSGYIGGVSDGLMLTGVRDGDGYARITLVQPYKADPITIYENGTLADGITLTNFKNENGVLHAKVDAPDTDDSEHVLATINNIDFTNYRYMDLTLTCRAYVNYGDSTISYGFFPQGRSQNHKYSNKYTTLAHELNEATTFNLTVDVLPYLKQPLYFWLNAENNSSEPTWTAFTWLKISKITLHN